MKKALPLIFALALVLCLALAVPALAADGDFTIENGVLTKYNGSGGDVTIPNGVTSIGDRAFYGCSGLSSVTIPDSVTSIGDDAFRDCSGLTSVTIPDSVTSVGYEAFGGCSGLTGFVVSPENSVYYDVDGVLFNRTGEICCFPAGKNNSTYEIPNGVTGIAYAAFRGCSGLTSITIPDSFTSIGDGAFIGCSGLTSITFPDNVTSIGESAFIDCSGLTSITIPNSVTSIRNQVFRDCTGLTSITIPDSVTSVGWGAFSGCKNLTDVYYSGSEEQWSAIWIELDSGNGYLTSANIHYNSTGPDTAPAVDPLPAVVQSPQILVVNGVPQSLEMYNIGGTNYIKLRDLAYMLNGTSAQFSIGWNDATQTATITSGAHYVPNGGEMKTGADKSGTAMVSTQTIIINGVVQNELKIYNIGGNNFFQIRNLEPLLGYVVGYDETTNTGSITMP